MKDSPLLQALPSTPWDLNAGACLQVRACAAHTSAFAVSGSSPKVMEDYPPQPSSCSLYHLLQLRCLEVFELEVVTNAV